MHIEKNICESVLDTLMNIDGKTKDTANTRKDLMLMGTRKELHLEKKCATYLMPIAKYTLTRDERKSLCEWVKVVKFPDGYASNISRCVNKVLDKISGMKSHDYHVFLQRLLPIAIRKFLTLEIRTTLTELSTFFNQLCAQTLKVDALKQMKEDIIMILCKLEKIFLPSFFDVMIHLAIHLPREAELAGQAQFRWMYPIKMILGKYKKYVRNRARPEGCIAEGYVANEYSNFCSMYLGGIETRWNREERNVDSGVEGTKQRLDVFSQRVQPFGAALTVILDHNEFAKARWYVLSNCNDTASYMK
jgi:septum formation topological specificity factor MinE